MAIDWEAMKAKLEAPSTYSGTSASGGFGSLAGYPSTAPSYSTCPTCGGYYVTGTWHVCTASPTGYAIGEQMAQIRHILSHDVGGRLDYIEGRVSNVREQIASLEERIQSLTEVLYSLLASFKELKR